MSSVPCTQCSAPLPADSYNTGRWARCVCGRESLVVVFPALRRGLAPGRGAERIVADGQAGCFYHPDKKAVVPCDACGRFLCELCNMEVGSKHYCTHCLEQARQTGRAAALDHRRVLYGKIALGVAVLPVLMWPLTAVGGPMAIVLALWSWKKPQSILGRSQLRKVLAIIIGLGTVTAWAFFFVMLFSEVFD